MKDVGHWGWPAPGTRVEGLGAGGVWQEAHRLSGSSSSHRRAREELRDATRKHPGLTARIPEHSPVCSQTHSPRLGAAMGLPGLSGGQCLQPGGPSLEGPLKKNRTSTSGGGGVCWPPWPQGGAQPCSSVFPGPGPTAVAEHTHRSLHYRAVRLWAPCSQPLWSHGPDLVQAGRPLQHSPGPRLCPQPLPAHSPTPPVHPPPSALETEQ